MCLFTQFSIITYTNIPLRQLQNVSEAKGHCILFGEPVCKNFVVIHWTSNRKMQRSFNVALNSKFYFFVRRAAAPVTFFSDIFSSISVHIVHIPFFQTIGEVALWWRCLPVAAFETNWKRQSFPETFQIVKLLWFISVFKGLLYLQLEKSFSL